MMRRPVFLTRLFWSNLFTRAHRGVILGYPRPPMIYGVGQAHKLSPEAEDALAWVSASVPVKPSAGVDIIEVNVWTEGAVKCAEHCWHMLKTLPSHRAALQLSHGQEHSDYHCCRCTNGLCHTGTRSSWLDRHPLTRYHKREPIIAMKK